MINKENVELLKADLRANARRYDQSTYGEQDHECGTVGCLAGFCLMRTIGETAYTWMVKSQGDVEEFAEKAGVAYLGIENLNEYTGHIFDAYQSWPKDLRIRYEKSQDTMDHMAMVEVACDALDRLEDDGTIRKLEE